jgi:ankyrin repeat protein
MTPVPREGHLAIVDYLYENGAKIEAKNDYGETALHEASKNGNLPVVEYLLAKGAQVTRL